MHGCNRAAQAELILNQQQRSDETYFQCGKRLGFEARALAKLKDCDDRPRLASSMSPSEREEMKEVMHNEIQRSLRLFKLSLGW